MHHNNAGGKHKEHKGVEVFMDRYPSLRHGRALQPLCQHFTRGITCKPKRFSQALSEWLLLFL
jgi:hypothetical protein